MAKVQNSVAGAVVISSASHRFVRRLGDAEPGESHGRERDAGALQ